MAAPLLLEDIIRQECIPMGDCMLTITDAGGEAAFLYFKGAELIEANYAALWGRDALAQIIQWKLEDSTVAPLPLGIKRSLWDPIEFLLNPGVVSTASGRLTRPAFNAQKVTAVSPYDRFKTIPSLLKLIHIKKGKAEVIHETPGEPENTDWLIEFADRTKSVGDTLGFGVCDKWTVETEKYQVVGLSHDAGFIVLLRRKEPTLDDLEMAVDAVLD